MRGHTWHGRKGGVKNAFRYGVDYVLIDASETEAPDEKNPDIGPALFARNRRAFVSVHDSDHGGSPDQGRGAAWVREVLFQHDLPDPAQICLLTQPRVLGHVFNPVSFWLCNDAKGDLVVVIAEVTNTFGDRHSYICTSGAGAITAETDIIAKKVMHVSPFQPVKGDYRFRFDIRPDRIGIRIEFDHGAGGVIATLVGDLIPMTNAGLLRAFLRRPFGARRVLALIHWQALKLWLKRAGYRRRPSPPTTEVSAQRNPDAYQPLTKQEAQQQ